jgi:predicted RNase H-like nuclease (RuvC/YqgF family)
MISQQHSSYSTEPRKKPFSITYSILLGTALILGLSGTALSGFLATRLQPLQQKVTDVAAKVQVNKPVSVDKEITMLTQQIDALDKTVQAQSVKLSKNNEIITNLKNELSQTRKIQVALREELSQYKNVQTDKNLLHVGTSEPQDIGRGFLVSYLDVEPTNTGINLSGYIINTAYVQHTNASFRITMAGQSKGLVIHQIKPSGIYKFELNFPEVPITKANHCRIEYETSAVLPVN